MNNINKNYWPVISYCSLIIFTNVTTFTVLHTRLNFPLYAIMVIIPIILWPASKFALDSTGYGKKIKKVWFLFPNIVHKGVSLFCLIWSGYFILKVIIPTLKKDYAKNK